MNREELIEANTRYEIQWFLDQDDQGHVDSVAEFFTKGGFTRWTTEELQEWYNLMIAPEER